MASRSAVYYSKNRRARKRKQAYDKKFNNRPSEIRKRTLLNRENRRRGTYGNGDGKDLSHTSNGLVYKDQSVNRGSTNDTPGDKRARGRKRNR